MSRVTDTVSFINKAKTVHSDKYTYENTSYISSQELCKITCRIHGDFKQRPNDHLKGQGCPECSPTRPISFDEFKLSLKLPSGVSVIKFNGTRFNHSSYVVFDCKKHGRFKVSSRNARKEVVCNECKKEKDIIDQFNCFKSEIKNKYHNIRPHSLARNIEIECNKHGWFKVSKALSVKGWECKQCKMESMTCAFINKALSVHGDRYDYSLVEYQGYRSDVKVICREHGVFSVNAGNHLKGQNCPKCKITNIASIDVEAITLYCLTSDHDGGVMKIGITTDLNKRIRDLKRSTPFLFTSEWSIEIEKYTAIASERMFHSLMDMKGYNNFDGASEWGSIDWCLIKIFKLYKPSSKNDIKNYLLRALSA
jgi:hypothetical protein